MPYKTEADFPPYDMLGDNLMTVVMCRNGVRSTDKRPIDFFDPMDKCYYPCITEDETLWFGEDGRAYIEKKTTQQQDTTINLLPIMIVIGVIGSIVAYVLVTNLK